MYISFTVVQEIDNETCNDTALGFENGLLPDGNISASSSLLDLHPQKARLGGDKAWCPQSNSSEEYLEVVLHSPHSICALATQGLHDIGAYTMEYRLQLSTDGLKWELYNHGTGEVGQKIGLIV